jgi:hypothetical protein
MAAYVADTLLHAQQVGAAIVPHPQRWPLYEWCLERRSTGGAAPSQAPLNAPAITPRVRTQALPADWATSHVPTDEIRARLGPLGESAGRAQGTVWLREYGPMRFPFPDALREVYDDEVLAAWPEFRYEFCVPADAMRGPEHVSVSSS